LTKKKTRREKRIEGKTKTQKTQKRLFLNSANLCLRTFSLECQHIRHPTVSFSLAIFDKKNEVNVHVL
jgi:hypothetical protein